MKSKSIPGRDPERWKYDFVGNAVLRKFTNCYGPLCHQYDHTYPWSLGGRTDVENCEILQSAVNNFKSNKEYVPFDELQESSIQMDLTTDMMDAIEFGVYGNLQDKNGKVKDDQDFVDGSPEFYAFG